MGYARSPNVDTPHYNCRGAIPVVHVAATQTSVEEIMGWCIDPFSHPREEGPAMDKHCKKCEQITVHYKFRKEPNVVYCRECFTMTDVTPVQSGWFTFDETKEGGK